MWGCGSVGEEVRGGGGADGCGGQDEMDTPLPSVDDFSWDGILKAVEPEGISSYP